MSNKVLSVKDLKPTQFLAARKFNYSVWYKANRKRFEWATITCKSDEDCELTIHYNVYNPELTTLTYHTIVIKGTQDELTPLVYLIELVATENDFFR